jgi:hypothetical protein
VASVLSAASSLIIQQGSEGTAAAVDRVLRVWRYLEKAAAGTAAGASGCFAQLSDAPKDVLLAALVRRGKHSAAAAAGFSRLFAPASSGYRAALHLPAGSSTL